MSETSSPNARGRNAYVDFLRAFSLLVVVAWHWVFTIVLWRDDGPHATNPIGFTSGMWAATWLLQVMPLFFYVGGYSHLTAWERARSRGESIGRFVLVRLKALAVPALADPPPGVDPKSDGDNAAAVGLLRHDQTSLLRTEKRAKYVDIEM